jgi:GTPase SAR1 family protein
MGLCSSSDTQSPEDRERIRIEKNRSKNLEKNMQDDHGKDQQVNKLLLLGAGESGKSTLFKQMITIYGDGFPESERRTFEPIIYNNVITSMQTLIHNTAAHGKPHVLACPDIADIILRLKGDEVVDEELANNIATLWNDAAVKEAYENRSKFQLTDSASYFFQRIQEVGKPDFLPTEQDVLRSRVRTTGIVENTFTIEGNQFKMFDVGGQRNERKKWIHCFENVTAVLFVGVLSEYDLVLYEDETTNRMEETLNLFDEIVNSRWFRMTSMILFLNKCDMFRDKIVKYPLNETCPVFRDSPLINTYDDGVAAIENAFLSKSRDPNKQIYVHTTCATATGNVHAVFDAVKDIIIRKSLGEAGLV